MPYLNLDDNYPDHPKIEALTDAAYRLHGAALAHCARFMLDGYLTPAQLQTRRRWSHRTQQELIDGRLLHPPGEPCASPTCPDDDGIRYRLHDFLQWNKPRAWWDEEREKAAKRKDRWKANRTQTERSDERD